MIDHRRSGQISRGKADVDSPTETALDPRLLLLDPTDNIVVTRVQLKLGDAIDLQGLKATMRGNADIGFKIARCAIACGDAIRKYGAPIGSATHAIAPGELVHLHNMKSDYIPTYTLGDGARFTNRGAT